MKLKNVLIVVKDIERSRDFYHDVFGLDLLLDNDGNMILTEGLVLQDKKIWKKFLDREIYWILPFFIVPDDKNLSCISTVFLISSNVFCNFWFVNI